MKFLGCASILSLVPFFITLGFAFSAPRLNIALEKRQSPITGVSPDLNYFSTLPSSPVLKWVACYEGQFFCARLSVPLDYSKPSRGTVKLALVKLPAKKTAKYKGAAYLQIGAGTSATNLVLEFGSSFQVGDLEGYDFIGWDVRGVGQSTPTLKCFPDEAARQVFVTTGPKILGNPSISLEESIKLNLEHSKVLADGCKKLSGSFLPYFDTPNNARDLHSIMCATGHEKIDAFWGYEYGTLIGETFASLYPNSYKYLILDGVVQGEKAYGPSSAVPSTVQDANKAFGVFFDSCAKAGAANCFFWEKTAELIEARFEKLVAALIKAPVPVPGLGEFGYSQLYSLIPLTLTAPGDPFYLYAFLAGVLAEAEKRSPAESIYGFLGSPLSPLINNDTIAGFEYPTVIQCLDSDPYSIHSPKDFLPYLKSMLRASKANGGVVAASKLACAGMPPFIISRHLLIPTFSMESPRRSQLQRQRRLQYQIPRQSAPNRQHRRPPHPASKVTLPPSPLSPFFHSQN